MINSMFNKKSFLLLCGIFLELTFSSNLFADTSEQNNMVNQSSTVTSESEPTSTSMIDTLKKISNCDPVNAGPCVVSTPSGVDFLNYLKSCSELYGWIIHYANKTLGSYSLSITADINGLCMMTIEDTLIPDQPIKKTCPFTAEQIASITTPKVFEVMKQVESSDSDTARKELISEMKILQDCIGPPRTTTKFYPLAPK